MTGLSVRHGFDGMRHLWIALDGELLSNELVDRRQGQMGICELHTSRWTEAVICIADARKGMALFDLRPSKRMGLITNGGSLWAAGCFAVHTQIPIQKPASSVFEQWSKAIKRLPIRPEVLRKAKRAERDTHGND